MASDTPEQNISQYFPMCNDFIHAARLRDGNVLIHCLAGMSRSVTVTVAYIMSVTHLSWKEALKVVRTGRSVANPNMGFQVQLQDYEMFKLADVRRRVSIVLPFIPFFCFSCEFGRAQERRRLKERFPTLAMELVDKDECTVALTSYQQLLLNRDICEGDCVRGQNCPTGCELIHLNLVCLTVATLARLHFTPRCDSSPLFGSLSILHKFFLSHSPKRYSLFHLEMQNKIKYHPRKTNKRKPREIHLQKSEF